MDASRLKGLALDVTAAHPLAFPFEPLAEERRRHHFPLMIASGILNILACGVRFSCQRDPFLPNELLHNPAEGSSHRQFFFFNDTATTEIYTLSLHDALPI